MPGPKKTKTNKKVKYQDLALQFERWWINLLDDHLEFSADRTIPIELAQEAGYANAEDFEEKVIAPLMALKPATIHKFVRILNQFYCHHSRFPLTFEVTYGYQKRFEAIFFLLAQVDRLQLFSFDELKKIPDLFREPVSQCLWCGQVDTDLQNNSFDGARKFCDAPISSKTKADLQLNQKSPEMKKGCTGKWKYFSDRIKQRIDRDAKSTEEAWKYLEDACLELLTHNQQTLKYSMRFVDQESNQLVEASSFEALLSPLEAVQELLEIAK